jgi:hypothetical protein
MKKLESIKVLPEIKKRFDKLGSVGMTQNDVIKMLLDFYEKGGKK